MFVVLVMLFGNPPVVRLRDVARRPAIVMVKTGRHPADTWPPLSYALAAATPDEAHDEAPRAAPAEPRPAERAYLPVKAA